MKVSRLAALAAVITMAASALWAAADPGVSFIGRGGIPGNSLDESGLMEISARKMFRQTAFLKLLSAV